MIQSNFPYERLSIINSSLDHKEIKPHTDIILNSLVGKLYSGQLAYTLYQGVLTAFTQQKPK